MRAWAAVLLVAAGSYGFRLAPLLAADRPRVVAMVEGALRFAGPAAMSALAVRAIHAQTIGVDAVDGVATGVAVTVGGVLAMRGAPIVVVAAAGLMVQLMLRLVVSIVL